MRLLKFILKYEIAYKTDAPKKNLKIHSANIIWSSKFISEGVRPTPTIDIVAQRAKKVWGKFFVIGRT